MAFKNVKLETHLRERRQTRLDISEGKGEAETGARRCFIIYTIYDLITSIIILEGRIII